MYNPKTKTMTALAVLTIALIAVAGCVSETPQEDADHREDTETFEIPSHASMEFKLRIEEGKVLEYSWSATRPVSFDFHGDTGRTGYTSHNKGVATNDQDTWTAGFTGNHGWWWQNNNQVPVTITLHTEGTYTVIGVV